MIVPVVCPKQPPKFSMHALWLLEINFHFLGLLLQHHHRNDQYTDYAYYVVNEHNTTLHVHTLHNIIMSELV